MYTGVYSFEVFSSGLVWVKRGWVRLGVLVSHSVINDSSLSRLRFRLEGEKKLTPFRQHAGSTLISAKLTALSTISLCSFSISSVRTGEVKLDSLCVTSFQLVRSKGKGEAQRRTLLNGPIKGLNPITRLPSSNRKRKSSLTFGESNYYLVAM